MEYTCKKVNYSTQLINECKKNSQNDTTCTYYMYFKNVPLHFCNELED